MILNTKSKVQGDNVNDIMVVMIMTTSRKWALDFEFCFRRENFE
jgi:hypothetical protein